MQGINDLVTPFLAVFLSPHMEGSVGDEAATNFPEEVGLSFKPLATYLCMPAVALDECRYTVQEVVAVYAASGVPCITRIACCCCCWLPQFLGATP